MNPWLGWSLAAAAVLAGWLGYGGRGVVLAISAVAFWLALQLGRTLRVMRIAAGQPLGRIDSAVMLQSRLRPGLSLLQILAMTRSLGRKVADDPQTFVWCDGGGDAVRVELRRGRLASSRIERAESASAADAGP